MVGRKRWAKVRSKTTEEKVKAEEGGEDGNSWDSRKNPRKKVVHRMKAPLLLFAKICTVLLKKAISNYES